MKEVNGVHGMVIFAVRRPGSKNVIGREGYISLVVNKFGREARVWFGDRTRLNRKMALGYCECQ